MERKIPLFDLNYDEREEQAVLETLRTGWISMGPKTVEFENRYSRMLGADYAVAFSSCTVSLHVAMRLLDLSPGDEVICPSLTFVATCNAIRYVNAIPVFADIKSILGPNIDPDDIEKKITEKTRAIIVMHFAGFPCDMERIMNIARKHNLKVVEDACHGPNVDYQGKKLGTIGDIGCFSFDGHKNMTTGEGGMLVTSDVDYSARARLLRSHAMTSMTYDRAQGKARSYDVVDMGYNYKYDDIHASIGLVQLEKLQADMNRRDKLRKLYVDLLRDEPRLTIPFSDRRDFSANYIFTVVLNDSDKFNRERIREQLSEAGIHTSVHYPAAHRFQTYQDFTSSLHITEYVTDNLITLPMYFKLQEDAVTYITSTLKRILNDK